MKIFLFLKIVFLGQYSEWSYKETDKENDNYCEYTPFMFAFVTLILWWVWYPVLVILYWCVMCGALLYSILWVCCGCVTEDAPQPTEDALQPTKDVPQPTEVDQHKKNPA